MLTDIGRYIPVNICKHTVALFKMNVNKNLSNYNKLLFYINNTKR